MNKKQLPENIFEEGNWSLLMNSMDNLLSQRLYSNGNSYGQRKITKLSSIAIERLTPGEEDQILDSYPQLVADDYRAWMVVKLREIGKQAFIEKAERAVKYGRNPQKLFVSLLK